MIKHVVMARIAVDILAHFVIVLAYVGLIFLLYSATILHKHRNELYFIKRGKIFVWIELIILMLISGVTAPLYLTVRYLNYFPHIESHLALAPGLCIINQTKMMIFTIIVVNISPVHVAVR